MRTTLDIDDVVLAAARSKARADGVSLGRALSDIAMLGLNAGTGAVPPAGFPVLHGVPGHLVTDEMVAAARDDD
ncbi:MAG: DUF2191 domain-containing protein [Austwickia sp.]|nr:MAG: DUF2191 domain-containing protein [Austwickia sp.]